MRILIMSDNPSIPTGMGKVHREIGRGLIKKGHEVISLGWFSPLHIPDWSEWQVHRTNNNYYGSDVFDSIISEEQPDIVLTIGDIWMVRHIADQSRMRPYFKWVGYVPIDGAAWDEGIPRSWHTVIDSMDYVVAYTEYGKRKILHSLPHLNTSIRVIPHGVDIKMYYPMPKEEINKWKIERGVKDDFIFLMVCRNQGRKNIPEFCKAWKKFKMQKNSEKCKFFPHMTFNDSMGWDLGEYFTMLNMWNDLIYMDDVAHAQGNINLISEEQLRFIYNICDVHVLIGGEGYGLPTLEAMACGKPVINIDHSANTELTEGRGELVKVSHYITGRYLTERPYPDEKSLIDAMFKMVSDNELREKYAANALEYAQQHTWDNAVGLWDKLLQEIKEPLKRPQFMEV